MQTEIVPKTGSSTRLDYVMRNEGAAWKAIDILVDGSISRVAVQRSDFRTLLRTGDPGAADREPALQGRCPRRGHADVAVGAFALLFVLLACAGLVQIAAGWLAVRRFDAAPAPGARDRPPVTILKPLHGAEPLLEQALASICEQRIRRRTRSYSACRTRPTLRWPWRSACATVFRRAISRLSWTRPCTAETARSATSSTCFPRRSTMCW